MKIEELKLAQDELQREDTYWCYTPTEFVCKGGELQLAKIQRLAEKKPILFVDWKRFCAGRSCSESCPGEIRHCPHFKEANVEVIENA